MKPAIEVKNLSKSYIINHKDRASYSTLKDDFSHLITSPFEKKESSEEKFWALKDINFEVNQGEIFGVIGRNGSGKSTLLKILSRIVQPTSGHIKMRGRVASLLEVGTGFHPELTGRENVYFNGSMLGMSRKEVTAKFDEIVAFSEVEKFIDTPVKFYSSGMYVRLAFSVAAHLDPDILILDEVLAVGDAAFQDKSLRKIRSTMENGTTVLFVSHSMEAVQKLCTKGILLNSGHIEHMGDTDSIVDLYKDIIKPDLKPEEPPKTTWVNDGKIGERLFKPIKTYVTNEDGDLVEKAVPNDADYYFNAEVEVLDARAPLTIGFTIHNEFSSVIYVSANTDNVNSSAYQLPKGRCVLSCKLPKHLLNEGSYTISLFGGILSDQDWVIEPESRITGVTFRIRGGLSTSSFWRHPRSGYVAPLLDWDMKGLK